MSTLAKNIPAKKIAEKEEVICIYGQGLEDPDKKEEFCASINHDCGRCHARLYKYN